MNIFTARQTQRMLERMLRDDHKRIIDSCFSLQLHDSTRSAYLIYWRLGTDEEDELFLKGKLGLEAVPQIIIYSIPTYLLIENGHLLAFLVIEVD